MSLIEREALQRIRLYGSLAWRDDWPSPATIANDALLAADREYAATRGAVGALHEAIRLARDFNRGAMTWQEYDRKLAGLEAAHPSTPGGQSDE